MSDGLVPIGTIIDWWRDENAPVVQPEPTGYQVCDGSEIRDVSVRPESSVTMTGFFAPANSLASSSMPFESAVAPGAKPRSEGTSLITV